MSSDLSPKRHLQDLETPRDLPVPAESHFHAVGDVTIECTGYSRIGNLLAVTIQIPTWNPPPEASCLPDSALACGFFLQHPLLTPELISQHPPKYPRPPWLLPDVFFVGSASIQIHDTASKPGPLGYQISLPLDSLHETSGLTTLEVIELLIGACDGADRTAKLHAVVAWGDRIGPENWEGRELHTFWKAECDIELPLKPTDNGSSETAAYWGKTELLPYLAEAHAIHAALLPNGTVLYFSGISSQFATQIVVDGNGLEMLFQMPNPDTQLKREHWIRLHHSIVHSEAKLFDPATGTVSTVPLPRRPSVEIVYYEPQINDDMIPDIFFGPKEVGLLCP